MATQEQERSLDMESGEIPCLHIPCHLAFNSNITFILMKPIAKY